MLDKVAAFSGGKAFLDLLAKPTVVVFKTLERILDDEPHLIRRSGTVLRRESFDGRLQWKDIDWDAKTITFGKSFWRGRLQDSTKTGQEHVRHMPGSLERILVKHLEGSKNIGPDDFVFCRSDDDPRPHDPDELRRVVLYPVLDRCGIKRTPRADGFHAFRRAASKYLRKAGGLELAAIQLGHKRMTTTDEHYNDRDMDDLKTAAELLEGAFWKDFGRILPPKASFAPIFLPPICLSDDERGF